MGVHIEDNKLVIITEPKTFRCDLPKNVGSLKHEMDFIIKYNEFLDEHTIKNEKKNKFILNLSQRLDLRSSNKHVPLQNLAIYYIWKNIRWQYKNNKLKIVAVTWNDEFKLPDLYLHQQD